MALSVQVTWIIYISSGLKTYLKFSSQLQPAACWLVYQAEAVCPKTVCLGTCAKVVSTIMLHLSLYIFVGVGPWKLYLIHD